MESIYWVNADVTDYTTDHDANTEMNVWIMRIAVIKDAASMYKRRRRLESNAIAKPDGSDRLVPKVSIIRLNVKSKTQSTIFAHC